MVKNSWWRLILFGLICFNPTSLSTVYNLRVYREFVYYSLNLYVLAFSIGLFLRLGSDYKKLLTWAIGLGLSLGVLMISREEGLWIMPTIVLLLIFSVFRILKSKEKGIKLRLSFLVISMVLAYLPTFFVSYLNYSHYGFWGISENLNSDYLSIRNTICSIKTSQSLPYRPISKEVLAKAYVVSPRLNELSEYIDKEYDKWRGYSDFSISGKAKLFTDEYFIEGQDIGNGHFMWLLRDALADNGYYSEGKFPVNHIHLIAQELKNACDNGDLDCRQEMGLPLVGSINRENIPLILHFFGDHVTGMLTHYRVEIADLDVTSWGENHKGYEYFRQFVYNPIEYEFFGNQEPDVQRVGGSTDLRFKMLFIKQKIMNMILSVYKPLTMLMVIIILSGWVIALIKKDIRKIYTINDFYILILLFAFLFSRLGTLSIIDATTAISGINCIWSAYLFMYLIIFLNIHNLARYFANNIQNFRLKKDSVTK